MLCGWTGNSAEDAARKGRILSAFVGARRRRSGQALGNQPLRNQDEFSADVTALTDLVGLRGSVEGERLNLDHQLVLGQ